MFYETPASEMIMCRRELRKVNDRIMSGNLQGNEQLMEVLDMKRNWLNGELHHWAEALNDGINVDQ